MTIRGPNNNKRPRIADANDIIQQTNEPTLQLYASSPNKTSIKIATFNSNGLLNGTETAQMLSKIAPIWHLIKTATKHDLL